MKCLKQAKTSNERIYFILLYFLFSLSFFFFSSPKCRSYPFCLEIITRQTEQLVRCYAGPTEPTGDQPIGQRAAGNSATLEEELGSTGNTISPWGAALLVANSAALKASKPVKPAGIQHMKPCVYVGLAHLSTG